MSDVTRILAQIERGEPQAAERLLPLVYDELRQLAAARLAREQPGQTLQATALVHEAYLRLVAKPGDRDRETSDSVKAADNDNLPPDSSPRSPVFDSRGHFFAAAAEAMRRILVENFRRKQRERHGGERQQQPLAGQEPPLASAVDALDLLALNEALDQLEATSPRKAQVVKLRYFARFTLPEIAHMLGISQSTAEADWTYAKTWLKRELERS